MSASSPGSVLAGGGLVVFVTAAIVLAAVVFAGVQLLRSAPPARLRPALSGTLQVPGTPPSFPWPTTGSAAMSVEGVGSLGEVGSTQPVPVASITKVMTAYVVLTDHPLGAGDTGPDIAVTEADVADYQADLATGQSVVQVTAGESLTELQALEGLLIASGNNLATMLADWDAGSTAAFVTEMNSVAQRLGLGSTHFDDPSGFDPGSVSTPADLIRLGEAAMALPAFSQIVDMGEVTLPVAGLIYNYNYDLGHDGIIGIKTGSDSAAGGCLLFEARRGEGARSVTLVGAVLGQEGTSPLDTALDESESLVRAALAAVGAFHVLSPGRLVAHIVAPWGVSVPVDATDPPEVIAWPGLELHARFRAGSLPSVVKAGTRVGVLRVDLGPKHVDVVLRASAALPGPSALWRLTHF